MEDFSLTVESCEDLVNALPSMFISGPPEPDCVDLHGKRDHVAVIARGLDIWVSLGFSGPV